MEQNLFIYCKCDFCENHINEFVYDTNDGKCSECYNDMEKLKKLTFEFDEVKSIQKVFELYKWYSLASGIKNNEKTLKMLKFIFY